MSFLEKVQNKYDLTDSMRLVVGSFSRLFDQIKNQNFAILSAFRSEYSKTENRSRNRQMLSQLRVYGLGGMMLKGGWLETQADGTKKEVTEESYLIKCPESLSPEKFKKIILDTIIKYNQDAAVVGLDGQINLLFSNGTTQYIGSGPKVSSGDIEGAFSKLRGYTFVIAGHLAPNSWVMALKADAEGIYY